MQISAMDYLSIMNEPKTIATLTINGAGTMTPLDLQRTADWLRHQADALQAEGYTYTHGTFTARKYQNEH
jgi:hypothetical protein